MIVIGAGASAISCAKIFIALVVNKKNIIMLDGKGILGKDREELDEHKTSSQYRINI